MAYTLEKVLIEQRITVFVWAEQQAKVVPCSMAPATFRNLKKFTEEIRKSSKFEDMNDDAIRAVWENAVEEVLARLHLNTFQV
jgi:hypothetical protein